jgi:ketosteroid isomerase-like protein
MTTEAELDSVRNTNDWFYRALSLADFDAMQRLWLASDDAICIHPGWPPLYGWAAIRESWRSIFQHQGPVHIWPSEVQIQLYGQTAEVTCLENIDSGQIRGAGLVQTRATNIFRLVKVKWKMLEHHAVPVRSEEHHRLDPFSSN